MSDSSSNHNKSKSLLTEGVNEITKAMERDKEYDPKTSCSKCCSWLLNEEKCWLTTTSSSRDQKKNLLANGPQTIAIGNWYKNTKIYIN